MKPSQPVLNKRQQNVRTKSTYTAWFYCSEIVTYTPLIFNIYVGKNTKCYVTMEMAVHSPSTNLGISMALHKICSFIRLKCFSRTLLGTVIREKARWFCKEGEKYHR